jgi:hypothetical protein
MRKTLVYLLIVAVVVTTWIPGLCVALIAGDEPIPMPSADDVVQSLKQLTGPSLERYLSTLRGRLGDMNNESIDRVLIELGRIESGDTYETPYQGKSASLGMRRPNRQEATQLRKYFICRKSLNEIENLPLTDRASRIMDVLEGVRSLPEGVSSECYSEGLGRMGPRAVSIILKRAPINGKFVEIYAAVLSRIGGPDVQNYFIAVLKEPSNKAYVRCDAVRQLEEARGEAVIAVLIEQLRDTTKYEQTRCGGQTVGSGDTDNQPCEFDHYPVCYCAAEALSRITERDWGPIFFDDYRTWAAWRDSPDKSTFHPFMLARSEAELRGLTRRVLHRQMTYHRTHMDEDYETPYALQVGKLLRPLGDYAIDVVLDEFRSRAPQMRNEKSFENLQSWASQILVGIDDVAGHKAAEDVSLFELTLPQAP